MPIVRCVRCHSEYPSAVVPHLCQKCSGIFDFDTPLNFDRDKTGTTSQGMWRYRHAFSLPATAPVVTLGEGNTPLVMNDYENIPVAFKLEMLNPTGSYKDRGTAVMMSQLLARGVTEAVEDSSGNAGASFAAYAARSGLQGKVFVPESASGPKRVQIEQYGAQLVRVPGPRSEAAKAVLEEVRQGAVYASHAYLPFGIAGIATIAYEIWEQMGTAPGSVIIPVGHGGLMLGILRGFSALKNAGKINRLPYYVGVQAEACAPAVAEYLLQLGQTIPVKEELTLAEGVRVRYPVRVSTILAEMSKEGGIFTAIAEEQILPAYRSLASQGFFVEPTSAIAWAAFEKLKKKIPQPVVIILTGSGLKYNP